MHQVADFLENLAKGQPTAPTFRDALATQAVCDAVLDSAEHTSGRRSCRCEEEGWSRHRWSTPARGSTEHRRPDAPDRRGGARILAGCRGSPEASFEGNHTDLLGPSTWSEACSLAIVFLLGGLSLVGPPLLLRTARKSPWGAGRLLWFAQGSASWLLWPPVIYHRVSREPMGVSGTCFYYGTPLMAVYVTLALLSGRPLESRHRRRIARSWQETFGLLLGLLWACTGLYFISLFYRRDFFGK